MAIGLGKMFGFEFNKNFESDYLKWLNEGTQLDLEKCPAQFKAILERLG